jgi:hypothetical protein
MERWEKEQRRLVQALEVEAPRYQTFKPMALGGDFVTVGYYGAKGNVGVQGMGKTEEESKADAVRQMEEILGWLRAKATA